MAIAVTDIGSVSFSLSVTSITTNFTSNVPGGSLIIALGFDLSSGPGAFSDTQGNVYLLAASSASSGSTVNIFYCARCKAVTTGDSLTYTDIASGGLQFDSALAVGQIWAASPLDTGTVNTTNGPGHGEMTTITSGVPVQAGELFIGCMFAATTPPNGTSPGWTTSFTNFSNQSAGTIVPAGQTAQTFAPTGSAGGWAAAIAGFMGAPPFSFVAYIA